MQSREPTHVTQNSPGPVRENKVKQENVEQQQNRQNHFVYGSSLQPQPAHSVLTWAFKELWWRHTPSYVTRFLIVDFTSANPFGTGPGKCHSSDQNYENFNCLEKQTNKQLKINKLTRTQNSDPDIKIKSNIWSRVKLKPLEQLPCVNIDLFFFNYGTAHTRPLTGWRAQTRPRVCGAIRWARPTGRGGEQWFRMESKHTSVQILNSFGWSSLIPDSEGHIESLINKWNHHLWGVFLTRMTN